MAPEENPHTEPEIPEDGSDISYNNARVENSAPVLPPYAYTTNGGMPPYYAQGPQMNSSSQGFFYGYPTAMQPAQAQSAYNPTTSQIPYGYQERLSETPSIQPGQQPYMPRMSQQPLGQTAYSPITQGPHDPQAYAVNPQQVTYNAPVEEEITASSKKEADTFDYTFITSPARIAIYDSLKTAPRVIQIEGAPTHEYIERIASLTYKNAKEEGGTIPYTVIREVSENFIHARFQEIVVSIMDKGNTIRFADQGPGIADKNLVQEPGISSATEPMKRYIRGVGSGLPIVKDYLDTSHGYIQIEDNINKGSVITISLVASRSIHDELPEPDIPDLTENEQKILRALVPDLTLGITELNRSTGIAVASVHTALTKMEEMGLVEKVNKKRRLTSFGKRIALTQ